jgi:hypothetical protein
MSGRVLWTTSGAFGTLPAAKFCDINMMIDSSESFNAGISHFLFN